MVRTVGLRHMSAIGTLLRSVMRVYKQDRYTGESCLVFNLLPEVVETPGMLSSPLAFSNPYPLAYAFEVFKCNAARGALSLLNEFPRDRVVNVVSKAGFFSTPLFKQAFSGLSAFSLKLASKLGMSGSEGIDVATRESFAIAIGSDVGYSKIDAQVIFRFAFWWFRNFNADIEPELTISEYKVSLTPDSFEVNFPIIAENERDINSVYKRLDVDSVSLLELPEAMVVYYSTVFSETMMFFLVALIGFLNLAYGTNRQLCSQPKLLSDVVVAKTVQNYLTGYLLFISYIGDVVAGSIKRLHSFKKLLLLPFSWLEFKSHCQDHNTNIVAYYQYVVKC